MSLLNFPPPASSECSYSLQEFNGQILSGTRKQFDTLQKSKFLSDYPQLERSSLSKLQHSLSRDDVKGAFRFRQSAANILKEITNENEHDVSEEGESVIGKAVLRVRNGIGMLSKMVSSDAPSTTTDYLDRYARTTNWSRAWLRCTAVDAVGGRIAVCQATDYIRIYPTGCSAQQQTPLTLHHAEMKNVAAMQFDPNDARLLAVAASSKVFVWRISSFSNGTKPSAQCIRVFDTRISPLSSIVWDVAWGNALIVASCAGSKIICIDLSTGEQSSLGAWFGGSVTSLYPCKDGTRIAVTYTSNVLRIYDRSTWTEEKLSGLQGRVTSVVWSPTAESLIFSTEDGQSLFSLTFTSHTKTTEEGVKMTVWSSSSRPAPVYDLSPIEFDPMEGASEQAVESGELRPVTRIGGGARTLTLSPDGGRLAVTFADRDTAGLIAVFIVDWSSKPARLLPSGFIEAAFSGLPECVWFLPRFEAGAMLAVSWSTGSVQYVPLVYGGSPAAFALSVHPLVEATGSDTILEESLGWLTGHEDSLASVELSARLQGGDDGGASPLLYTEILRDKSAVGLEL